MYGPYLFHNYQIKFLVCNGMLLNNITYVTLVVNIIFDFIMLVNCYVFYIPHNVVVM